MAFLPSPAGYYSRSELLTATETRHWKKALLAFYRKIKWNAIIFTGRRCSEKKNPPNNTLFSPSSLNTPKTQIHQRTAQGCGCSGTQTMVLKWCPGRPRYGRVFTHAAKIPTCAVGKGEETAHEASFPCGSIPVPRQPASPRRAHDRRGRRSPGDYPGQAAHFRHPGMPSNPVPGGQAPWEGAASPCPPRFPCRVRAAAKERVPPWAVAGLWAVPPPRSCPSSPGSPGRTGKVVTGRRWGDPPGAVPPPQDRAVRVAACRSVTAALTRDPAALPSAPCPTCAVPPHGRAVTPRRPHLRCAPGTARTALPGRHGWLGSARPCPPRLGWQPPARPRPGRARGRRGRAGPSGARGAAAADWTGVMSLVRARASGSARGVGDEAERGEMKAERGSERGGVLASPAPEAREESRDGSSMVKAGRGVPWGGGAHRPAALAAVGGMRGTSAEREGRRWAGPGAEGARIPPSAPVPLAVTHDCRWNSTPRCPGSLCCIGCWSLRHSHVVTDSQPQAQTDTQPHGYRRARCTCPKGGWSPR